MNFPKPPEHMKTEKPEAKHLKVYMECQICHHKWVLEFFGILFDIAALIEGCPSCKKVKFDTGRASLEMLKFEEVDNPYIVKE